MSALPPVTQQVVRGIQGPAGVSSNGSVPTDLRLASFLERYLIERTRNQVPSGDAIRDGWQIITEGETLYKMIQLKGQRVGS